MKPSEFAARVEGRRAGEGVWMARCPAHDDRSPSLKVSTGRDGRVLINCKAGCTAGEITEALSITLADLFPEPLEPRRRRRPWRPSKPSAPRRWLPPVDKSALPPDELAAREMLEGIEKQLKAEERMQRLLDETGEALVKVGALTRTELRQLDTTADPTERAALKGRLVELAHQRDRRPARTHAHMTRQQRADLAGWIVELELGRHG